MNDNQLLRYSRQIMLPELEVEGQQRLLSASCLIVGVGGLGSPAAMYLAAAGIGKLILCDFDRVDLTNLQRQIIHGTSDIGRPKVESAQQRLSELNPEVQVRTLNKALEGDELMREISAADVVLDCSDNFTTRFAVNRACVATNTPLVSGACIRFEAQISVFDPRNPLSPCYQCLYEENEELAERCAQTGVIAPLTGIVGSIQALEAIKLISGVGQPLIGKLAVFDALSMEWRQMVLPKNRQCPICSVPDCDPAPENRI